MTDSKSIVLAGVGGMIGSRLRAALGERGYTMTRMVRPVSKGADDPSNIPWDPLSGSLDVARLEKRQAVIHLGGENVASGLWTRARRQRILDSRISTTSLLARSLARLEHPPPVFLVASAVGFYGDRGDELLDEEKGPGTGFLADVARAWEGAVAPAVEAGIRVVNLRIGVVLSKEGGALARMDLPFRLGLGGRLGSGRQYFSWISLQDVVAAIVFCLENDGLAGPVNLVSPQPVTNTAFTKTLAAVLKRPAILPVPAFALRMMLGDMANEMLLASFRVVPRKLQEAGFNFTHPELEEALRDEL